MSSSMLSQSFPQSPLRTMTELDYVRISKLLGRQTDASDQLPAIHAVLDMADLVPSRDIAPDVVTMYTRVLVGGTDGGPVRELTLCYPGDANVGAGHVSVLSPIGAALLGVSVGGAAHWTSPHGQTESLQVLAIQFQPEASGDYTR
jgi:regulator of nucleoside diphosphate kinase